MNPKSQNETKKSFPKWAVALVALLVILAAALLAIPGGESAPEPTETAAETLPAETAQETVPEETQVPASARVELLPFENGQIQTPWFPVSYPESFEDYLLAANTCQDPYILEFYAALPDKPEQKLFDLILGADADGLLGHVQTDAGEVSVSMTVYTFVPGDSWNEGEINTVLAMQEAANDLIRSLNLITDTQENNGPVVQDAPAETPVVNFITVETPYCPLQYPALWGEFLRTEAYETEYAYRVDFYCAPEGHDRLLMFSVLLGGDEGEQLGIVTNEAGITVPVNILMNAPDAEGLTPEAQDTLFTMQEAVNQLIQQLPLQ